MIKDSKVEEIKVLIEELNSASEAYYKYDREIMSNFEYDEKYDRLVFLEKETGTVFANSPTQNVGYETLAELPKEKHPKKMLSLDKTKEIEELKSWLKDKEGILSWKLDGLTMVLTYEDGKLVKAVTRGNGEIGEVITNNARVFANLPLNIKYKGKVVLRGEAIIRYSDFEKINNEIPEADAKYKNPRNLCSGSVRQLNNRITKERNVMFYAFSLVEGEDVGNSEYARREWLKEQGFEVVYGVKVNAGNITEVIKDFQNRIGSMDEPSDGLVLTYDDIDYGKSLGATSKFPKNAIAFKWKDEIRETVLREIEWSASRTGLINPIAIFDPVELEGTTVSRASVHNVSILKDLKLGIGDSITVYKANMIIPQIAENLTASGNLKIPDKCPVCEQNTVLKKDVEAEMLYCVNKSCPAKMLKNFSLFVSRDAMNIEGLSEATIEKFIQLGILKEPADFFRLQQYKEQIVQRSGFGEKSYNNLIESIENAKKTTPRRLLYGLGIKGIGAGTASLISGKNNDDWNKIINLSKEELLQIEGVGETLADAFVEFFENEETKNIARRVADKVTFKEIEVREQKFNGLTVVITGSLENFSGRKELKEIIEMGGGKVAGSVSSNTDYLINNDTASKSAKNKKAVELGIEIISEKDFMERFQINA